MGTKEVPTCPRHDRAVRMTLHTLHSDQSAPDRVLAVYVCPECGSERRIPIEVGGRAEFAWGGA